jgi:hypothetical protein
MKRATIEIPTNLLAEALPVLVDAGLTVKAVITDGEYGSAFVSVEGFALPDDCCGADVGLVRMDMMLETFGRQRLVKIAAFTPATSALDRRRRVARAIASFLPHVAGN